MDNDSPAKRPYLWVDRNLEKTPGEPPCVEHTFMFVNESTARAGFKAGRRREVRSHIRKHVIKNYKKEQKKSMRHEEAGGPRYPALAPLVQKSDTSDANDSRGLAALSGAEREKATPTFIQELDEEWEEPYPWELSSGVTQTNQDVENQWTGEPRVAKFRMFLDEDSPPKPQEYCVHCGAPKDKSQASNQLEQEESSMMLANSAWKKAMEPNPIQLLGAGRVDPFLSYPGEATNASTHELMDHTITYLLPGLVPDGFNAPINPVAKAWFSGGLKLPLLFHALVFAGSIHLDFMRCSAIYPNSPIALSHKLAVIQQLNMILSNPKEAQRDEVILAILILASHEARVDSESRVKPFNSPLMNAQWLNVYGNIEYVPEHMKAVMELIALRGGIENLKLHGLAETIVCGDVIAATNNLSKPVLPPLRSLTSWISTAIAWANSPKRFPVQVLGRGFQDLQPYGLTRDAIHIFHAMGSATIAIDHYLQGIPASLTLGQISMVRTAVHQRLLLLPSVDELVSVPNGNGSPSVYEACRTTASIYSIGVLYPIPNTFQPFQTLVSRLKAQVEGEKIEREAILSNLLLWMLVIGGIAALEKPERRWFVAQLRVFVKRWNVCEWRDVEKILDSYLWLESACGQGGRRLWEEVMDLNV